jgi:hypothetical protein
MISIKRSLPVALTLSAAVVVGGSALAAAATTSATGNNGAPANLHYMQHMTKLVVVPGPGQKDPNDPPTPGAISSINVVLSQGKEKPGQGSLTCIADSRKKFLCSGVYTLPGGQIAISELVPGGDPWNGPGAITGGTGKYRDASGQILTTPINETDSHLVIQLEH